MCYYIYQIKNTINNKIYIGFSHNYFDRWKAHIYGYHNTYIQRAIKKNGADKFIFSVLDATDDYNSACEKEKIYIIRYNSKSPNGYNLTYGGEGILGYKPTIEQNIQNSLRQIGRVAWNKGIKWSEEHKKKLSEIHTGKVLSEEHKENIAKSCIGRINTKESREKISNSLKGHYVSDETRKKQRDKKLGVHWKNGRKAPDISGKNNPFYGKKHSEETRQKIVMALKNRREKLGMYI